MTKEQIMQELEKLPEPLLLEVLEFARTLQIQPDPLELPKIPNAVRQGAAWAAYLASKQERAEVYRRLANS